MEFLPMAHVASRTCLLQAGSATVWAAISDFKSAAAWRSDLQSVEAASGGTVWHEVDHRGQKIAYAVLEAIPEQRLVRKIVSEDLPFGGTWTFELKPQGKATSLTITENGEVYNLIFRIVSRFVFGYYASMDRYLRDLKKFVEN